MAGERSPTFWRTATTPWVGAEFFLWDHGSVDVSANFQPGTTERLAGTPWILTYQRHSKWLSASMRIFH